MSITPAYCALDVAYADWNFKNQGPIAAQTGQKAQATHGDVEKVRDSGGSNGIKNFCPNCNNCLRGNDILQQSILDQTIWPRQRWVPQDPHAYVPHDPFNRYWMNNNWGGGVEHFGGGSGGGGGTFLTTETLLQIILFILVALFIIQLIECIYYKTTEKL